MMVGRKPKLDPVTVRRLREWAAFGRSVSEVATKIGVNRRTVYHYLRGQHKREVA